MSGDLENQIAVVTGGAQGLGQAISGRLAREGCHVIIADVNETGAGATAARSPRKPAGAPSGCAWT